MYGNNNMGFGYGGLPNYISQQPNYQPAPQQPQPIQPKIITIYVNGIEEAKGYVIASNTTAYLIDTQSPTIFIKTTDANGFATFKEFEVKEKTETPPVEYVTKTEYQELLDKFDKLEKSRQPIQSQPINSGVNNYE